MKQRSSRHGARVEARTHGENVAEQKSLLKAGFHLEGVVRAAEFRDGRWRDGQVFSRLRDDPAPLVQGTAERTTQGRAVMP